MISCLSQAMNIFRKKNSNSVSFHEMLKSEKDVWMKSYICCWTFLNAVFTIAVIIVWRILTYSLKKTNCDSDSDVIIEKELSCSSLYQTDLSCDEVKVTEYCVYNELTDLFLNRLEIKKNFMFKISDTAETDENFVDDYVLNIEIDKN